jgi:hypothetical protein
MSVCELRHVYVHVGENTVTNVVKGMSVCVSVGVHRSISQALMQVFIKVKQVTVS